MAFDRVAMALNYFDYSMTNPSCQMANCHLAEQMQATMDSIRVEAMKNRSHEIRDNTTFDNIIIQHTAFWLADEAADAAATAAI